jgi:hypothetical protein
MGDEVLAPGQGHEVRRLDAGPIAASVVNVEAGRDGAMRLAVRDSMGRLATRAQAIAIRTDPLCKQTGHIPPVGRVCSEGG